MLLSLALMVIVLLTAIVAFGAIAGWLYWMIH